MSDSNQPVQSSQPPLPQGSRVSWTAAMNRALLDCVDEAAGDDTIFITDKEAAFEKIYAKLDPVTHPTILARLDWGKVYNKLMKQAVASDVTPKEFLKTGTRCLDLSKLQADTYSKEEIQASKQRSQEDNKKKPSTSISSTRTTHENESSKRGPSRLEDNPGTSASAAANVKTAQKKGAHASNKLKRSHKSAFSHDQEHAHTATSKRTRTTQPISYEEIQDSQSSADESQDEFANDVEMSEPIHKSQNQPAPKPSAASQTEVVYVCEVCEESFHAKDILLNHKRSHEQLKSAQSTSRSVQQVSTAPDFPPGAQKILAFASWIKGGEHTDVDDIRKIMERIQTHIANATHIFLADMKIDGNETIQIGVDSYEDSLIELLHEIFNAGPVDNPLLPRDTGSPLTDGIRRRAIVMAVIGSAVTKWALRPLPQGRNEDGILAEMNKLLWDQSPAYQDRLMEFATKQYLAKSIKPLAKGSARVLAQELFHLLRHFLPDEVQQSNSFSEVTGSDSTSPSPRPPPRTRQSSEWPHKTQRDPTRIFLGGLEKVFMFALELRLDMEMKGNAKYTFSMPTSGVRVSFREMVVRNPANNVEIHRDTLQGYEEFDDESQPDRLSEERVLVGLVPTVRGTFRKGDRGEEWRDHEILISQGYVFIQSR